MKTWEDRAQDRYAAMNRRKTTREQRTAAHDLQKPRTESPHQELNRRICPLNPCSCGETKPQYHAWSRDGKTVIFWIECPKCHRQTYDFTTPEAAAAAWNLPGDDFIVKGYMP